MYRPGLQPATPKTPFDRKHQQDLIDGVNSVNTITGDGIDVHNGPNGRSINLATKRNLRIPIVAKITATTGPLVAGGTVALGIGWYLGRLQEPQLGGYKPKNAYTFSTYYRDRSGTDDCYIINKADAIAGSNQLVVGDYVEGFFTWAVDDTTLVDLTVIEVPAASAGASSIGQLQGQAEMMVTDNQSGWSFPFLCPEL